MQKIKIQLTQQSTEQRLQMLLFWSIPLLLYVAMRIWYFYDPPAMPRDAVYYLHRAGEFISGGCNNFGDDISLRHRLYYTVRGFLVKY